MLGKMMLATAIVAFVSLPAVSPSRADVWHMPGLEQARVVPDAELAEMRGRFISPAQIASFQVYMLTSWQTAEGISVASGMNMTVNLSDGQPVGQPSVTASWMELGVPDGTDLSALQAGNMDLGIGGLANVHGAVQSVHLVGDDNTGDNDMRINIVTPDIFDTLNEYEPLDLNALEIPIDGTTVTAFDSGATTTFVIEGNFLGMDFVAPAGQGAAVQGLGGGANKVAQHIRTNGDANQVHTLLDITFVLDSFNAPSSAEISAALGALKGLQN